MSRSNRWIVRLFCTAVVGGIGLYPSSTQSVRAEDRDLNPRIHHALEALHDAHKEIDEARHDFHGRKHEALDVLDKAIAEMESIKDYDR